MALMVPLKYNLRSCQIEDKLWVEAQYVLWGREPARGVSRGMICGDR